MIAAEFAGIMLNDVGQVAELYPIFIPRAKAVVADDSQTSDAQSCCIQLLGIAMLYWPSLLCDGHWFDVFLQNAKFRHENHDSQRTVGSLRALLNIFRAANKISNDRLFPSSDGSSTKVFDQQREASWASSKVIKEMRSGRLVDIVYGHVTNPKTVNVTEEVFGLVGSMVAGGFRKRMDTLVCKEVLSGLCISGTGTEHVET